jgi:myo-inositol-1(or 4)-monophosphatase
MKFQTETPSEPVQTALSAEQESHYLKVARTAALAAGKIQMAAFGTSHKIMTKGTTIDLVTSVDRECDDIIIETIQKACPNDLFLTEEHFEEDQAIDLSGTWVIDPLDGTTNYAHGFPHFAVSIAYLLAGEPVIGVIYDPFKKEMFYGIRNRGAFLNDSPIYVSSSRTHALDHALLATGFPYDIATSEITNLDHFRRIAPKCHGVRRPGAAALDLAYVACGRLDGFWELKLSVWDIAAGVLLIQEAGGKVTAPAGGPIPFAQRRIDLIGSNGTGLHEELQTLLAADI